MKTFFYNIVDKAGKTIFKSKEVFTSEFQMQKDINSQRDRFPFGSKVVVYSNKVPDETFESIEDELNSYLTGC